MVMTTPGASSTEVALMRREPGLAARASATCRLAVAAERWLGANGVGLPPAVAGVTPARAVAIAAITTKVASLRTRGIRTREPAMRVLRSGRRRVGSARYGQRLGIAE